jgi:hypothetical protein
MIGLLKLIFLPFWILWELLEHSAKPRRRRKSASSGGGKALAVIFGMLVLVALVIKFWVITLILLGLVVAFLVVVAMIRPRQEVVRKTASSTTLSVPVAIGSVPVEANLLLPKRVTEQWLEREVPKLNSSQLAALLRGLRKRGWSDLEIATRVIPRAQGDRAS